MRAAEAVAGGAAASGIGLGTPASSCPGAAVPRARLERNQNPAKPSGLLYGIGTLVTSSSEPSGFVA